MRILIATHNGLFIFEDDGEKQQLDSLARSYFYGAIIDGDTVIAARRDDAYSKRSPTSFLRYSLEDGKFLEVMSKPNGRNLLDLHQIAKGPRGYYFCVGAPCGLVFADHDFTFKAAISYQDAGGSIINSCGVYGDNIWAIKHHKVDKPAILVKARHFGSQLAIDDYYQLPHHGVHNVIVEDGYVYYNASYIGGVMKLSLEGFATEDWEKKGVLDIRTRTLGEEFHTKGMISVGDKLIVGVSENGPLEVRFTSKSAIMTLDKEMLEISRTVRPVLFRDEPIGNINELVLIEP